MGVIMPAAPRLGRKPRKDPQECGQIRAESIRVASMAPLCVIHSRTLKYDGANVQG